MKEVDMNPQAEALNSVIEKENPNVFSMLSRKGKEIFFPAKGILAQSGDAREKRINATIGMAMEDDGTPMRLKSVSRYIDLPAGEVFPYAPSAGLSELKTLWKSFLFEKNPSLEGRLFSTPVICSALTHGLSMCGYLFVDPDDEIILPDLYWGNYNLVFGNAFYGKFSTFPTFKGQGFNGEGLREKLLAEGEKKILILNFPNNPTGYTPLISEMEIICASIKEAAGQGKKIVVICDDAYFGLVFEEEVYKESVFSMLTDLDENVLAVKVDGATKEDYAWGFRVGFITYGCRNGSPSLYSALENKTGGAVRSSISSGPRISQSLLLKAYSSQEYQEQKEEKFNLIRSRYEEVKNVLRKNPQYRECFEPLPFNSGYFMCFKLNDKEGESIRQILLDQYDTGVIAIGSVIRIAFSALEKKLIPELIENLYSACKGSKK